MEPQQQSFDDFGHWLLTRLLADMAPFRESPAAPLHPFLAGLYTDMLAETEAYFIPHEPFGNFFARVLLTPEETAHHEALKTARIRVRSVVFAYLEFLYGLGRAGTPNGADLQVPRAEFERLATAAMKMTKTSRFLNALERCGLSFTEGDPLLVTNPHYPGMPAALAAQAQACAGIKDFALYFFRRCDAGVFEGKKTPNFNDALGLVPAPYKCDVAETDARLTLLRFKREIFVDSGDMAYRVRYSKKSGLVVYWCRILESFEPDLAHYLRWKLNTDLTPQLFERLESTRPGLAQQVFNEMKPCALCYGENCQDRVLLEWDGISQVVCKGRGWDRIGHNRADYERLWTVLETINELV